MKLTNTMTELQQVRTSEDYFPALKDVIQSVKVRIAMSNASKRLRADSSRTLKKLIALASQFAKGSVGTSKVYRKTPEIAQIPSGKAQLISLFGYEKLAGEGWDSVYRLTRLPYIHGIIHTTIDHFPHFASLRVTCLPRPAIRKHSEEKDVVSSSASEHDIKPDSEEDESTRS
jgi:hypothetical protein